MFRRSPSGRLPLLLGALAVAALSASALAAGAVAEEASEVEFQRGYFLQTHDADCEGAAAAFEKVAADANAAAAMRCEATVRLAQCREDLAAADFARLMPPEALAYVEITHPGRHVAQLLQMLGLTRDGYAPSVASKSKGTPLVEGLLYFPDDFSISPAWIAELDKLNGVAVAITSVDMQRGKPSGVAIIHPGDVNPLRGELESLVQLLEPDEPIDGYRTYQVQGQAWLAVTARMIIASDTREGVAATIGRMKNPEAANLAGREDFQRSRSAEQNTLMFLYASGPQLLEQFGSHLAGREAAIARAVLDLDHLESLTAMVGTTENGIQARGSLNLQPGHNNLAYGLIRTAPLSKRSLEYVPSGIAGLALWGLNPAGAPVEREAGEQLEPLSAMDLGREVFANVEEIALFALPAERAPSAGPPIPEIGLIIAAKDPAKSEMLWNQLLSLPVMFGLRGAASPQQITIAGHQGNLYSLPDAPPIAVVRLGDALIAGTQPAVAAAVEAGSQDGGSICADAAFQPLLERLGTDTSKAVLIDTARVVRAVAAAADGRQAPQAILMASAVLKDLKISAVTEEGPTRFAIRAEAAGLPNVPALIKGLLAGQMQHGRAAASPSDLLGRIEKHTEARQ